MKDHNCHVESLEKPIDQEALKNAQVIYLAVSGMGCQRCAMRVRNSLLLLDGVAVAEVYLQQSIAAVAYDPAQVTPNDLLEAVARAGNDGHHHYEAQMLRQLPAAPVTR